MSVVALIKGEIEVAAISSQKRNQNNLQILRGIASIAVVWHHIGGEGYLDPNYKLDLGFVPYGHMRPLLFFMLSGYLVSLSNRNRLSNWGEIKAFGKKRLYRLYPIYLLVVFVSFWIATEDFSHIQLWSHFLFLQNLASPVVHVNGPLWSMNFEILFYAFFVLISFFKIRPSLFIVTFLSLGVILFFTQIEAPLLISYCFGLTFWGIGLFGGSIEFKETRYPTSYLISLALLLFCYQQLDVTEYFLNKGNFGYFINRFNNNYHPVKFQYLIFIPVCVLIIMAFNNKDFFWRKFLIVFVYLPIIIRVVFLFNKGDLSNELFVSVVLFLISFFCLVCSFNLNIRILERGLNFLGSISYGIYLVHLPIMVLFIRIMPFSGALYTAILRLIVYLLVVFGISFFLERKFQSFVMRLLENRLSLTNLENLLKKIMRRSI